MYVCGNEEDETMSKVLEANEVGRSINRLSINPSVHRSVNRSIDRSIRPLTKHTAHDRARTLEVEGLAVDEDLAALGRPLQGGDALLLHVAARELGRAQARGILGGDEARQSGGEQHRGGREEAGHGCWLAVGGRLAALVAV